MNRLLRFKALTRPAAPLSRCSFSTVGVSASVPCIWSAVDPEKQRRSDSDQPTDQPSGFFSRWTKRDDKKSSGKGSSSKPPTPPWLKYVPIGIGLVAFPFLVDAASHSGEQQITFHEFSSTFLRSGLVERLVVVNESAVRVYLKSSASTQGIHQQQSPTIAGKVYDSTEHSDPNQWGTRTNSPTVVSSSAPSASGGVYYFTIGDVQAFEERLDKTQAQMGVPLADRVPVYYVHETSLGMELLKLAPTLLLIGGFIYLNRSAVSQMGMGGGGGMFGIGKAKPQIFSKENGPKVTFNDVAGMDEAKVEIMEFVQFLKSPDKFLQLGARIPKGALLVGPPGTGKTLLAKAVAGEAGVPFFSISGSDFIEMFVGVGPSRVRDLFAQARKAAPCIVFIDEIDAVGRQRGRGQFSGASDERDNTLNQLLVEMDGFSSSSGVVVLAGTNRADILDKALLRPGRFDRQVTVDAPDMKGRIAIFKIHLRGITLDPAVTVDDIANRMAELTPGFVGADIMNVCNEAALIAARRDAVGVALHDFESAIDRVIGGLERKARKLNSVEKKVVAYHEAGHAIVGWFLKYTDPLVKVSIIPRGKAALGFAQYLPSERFINTQDQMLDFMCMALGGRAAEELVFGHLSTGASDDLQRVTRLAYGQVSLFGMSAKLGAISYPVPDNSAADQFPFELQKPFSDETAAIIDSEVSILVKKAYDRTLALLRDHRKDLEAIAQLLMSKEVISQNDVAAAIGARPFGIRQHLYDDFGVLEKSDGQDGKDSK